MEHLISPGTKAPIRVPFFWRDADFKDENVYKSLWSRILAAQQRPENAPSQHEQAQWWSDTMCSHGGPNLWNMLAQDFFFGIPFKILSRDASLELVEDSDQDGFRYLSTRNLTRILEKWQGGILEMNEEDKKARLLVAKVVLSQSAIILRHLSRVLYVGSSPQSVDGDAGLLTHFACVVIHQAMVEACGKVLGLQVRAGNEFSLRGCLPLLYYTMSKDKWCPWTLWKLQTMTDIDEWVYAFSLGTAQTERDHSQCTTTVCEANHMSQDSLPMHVLNGSCRECRIIDVPVQDMLDEVGVHTPLVRITGNDADDLSLEVTRLTPTRHYIAISHVWADGLGCSQSNCIRTCGLLELSNMTKKLEEEFDISDLCVWADTLCIPLDPALRKVRESQIQRMNLIYRNGFAVLVIDGDLVRMRADADIREVGIRLELSACTSRLWTYQEGSMNDRLLILAQDGVVDVTAFIREQSADLQTDAIHTRIAQKMWSWTTFTLGRVDAGLRRPAYDDPDYVTGNELYEIESSLRRTGDRRAQMLIRSIDERTTSRSDDEAVVIASCLNLDTTSIIQAPAQDRMKKLIESMPTVPANMIFAVGLRLSFPGFRWAPSTLLRSKGGGCFTAPVEELVPMSLDQIENNHVFERRASKLDESGRGLRTFNAGIRLPRECFTGNEAHWEIL